MPHKEAYRYFWMIKGHFNSSETTVLSCAEQYFMRCWRAGCDGAPLSEWEEGFEEAYSKIIQK